MILHRVFPVLVAAVAMALPSPGKAPDAPAPALCLPTSCCNNWTGDCPYWHAHAVLAEIHRE
ncbi:hypothetical protein X797_010877 [Metarhizium robertsii]|uniref:Uncharacterized protein n=1 Tax=Metarhizium robertsii TaxID=568076 RepID=A0A014PJS8_9HYPO|nr:hypothetical protein X797_010877 [Metarhizium robertsii]